MPGSAAGCHSHQLTLRHIGVGGLPSPTRCTFHIGTAGSNISARHDQLLAQKNPLIVGTVGAAELAAPSQKCAVARAEAGQVALNAE